MARNYTFAPDEYYHVYNRGFEKTDIFRDSKDYNRFLEALYLCNSKQPIEIRSVKQSQRKKEASGGLTSVEVFEFDRGETLVDIGAYCLMPNHFHLLIREKEDGGISKFMQKHTTSYTMYVNKKYERTGALFGSSFKAVHVSDDTHLKYLFAYIHLNPKDIIGTKGVKTYPYSSYLEWVGADRPQGHILNKEAFPDYFEGNIKNEIDEWINFEQDSFPNPPSQSSRRFNLRED